MNYRQFLAGMISGKIGGSGVVKIKNNLVIPHRFTSKPVSSFRGAGTVAHRKIMGDIVDTELGSSMKRLHISKPKKASRKASRKASKKGTGCKKGCGRKKASKKASFKPIKFNF